MAFGVGVGMEQFGETRDNVAAWSRQTERNALGRSSMEETASCVCS